MDDDGTERDDEALRIGAHDSEAEYAITADFPDELPDDRDRGILREEDRRFLRNKSDVEPKSDHERKVRARIRNRVFHGLVDFSLIFRCLEERDRKQIFDFADRTEKEAWALQTGMMYALALLYEQSQRDGTPEFEYLFRVAVGAVEQGGGTITFEPPEITVNIDTSGVIDLGRVGEKLKEGRPDTLTEDEVDALEFVFEREKGEMNEYVRESILGDIQAIRETFLEDDEE